MNEHFMLHSLAEAVGDLQEKLDRTELAEVKARMQIEQLQEILDRKNEVHDVLNRDYVKVRYENKRLREVLEFYADELNWQGDEPEASVYDKGTKARKALGVK